MLGSRVQVMEWQPASESGYAVLMLGWVLQPPLLLRADAAVAQSARQAPQLGRQILRQAALEVGLQQRLSKVPGAAVTALQGCAPQTLLHPELVLLLQCRQARPYCQLRRPCHRRRRPLACRQHVHYGHYWGLHRPLSPASAVCTRTQARKLLGCTV